MADALTDAGSTTSPNETTYTPPTTSWGITDDFEEDKDHGFRNTSVPEAGSLFLIQSVATGEIIDLDKGKVILSPIRGTETKRWLCTESKGQLGFQDPKSGLFLGYDENEELCCMVRKQNLWEYFSIRPRPEGGYLLLMCHYNSWLTVLWSELRPVGLKGEGESQRLAVITDRNSGSTVWQFIKV
ncbi:hypothetical protein B0J11DRAFT_545041 [Dendryphion nanum]|uniref:Uncharacterized protein n=1 Tax=Dendryphion nanum TaxID=256645 RepID=A0A9P9CZ17_9PLEO|nr:hypothetical protein B0J11DRAFT_545041 [Dendryphion nanum]